MLAEALRQCDVAGCGGWGLLLVEVGWNTENRGESMTGCGETQREREMVKKRYGDKRREEDGDYCCWWKMGETERIEERV